MATIQISRTKGTETLNKTEVTQKQSIDVVQTMLHGSLSCITYLRSLFAQKAYDEQVYGLSGSVQSYEEYASGTPETVWRASSERGTRLQVLRRGRSRRGDMMLDWLEHGAFPALQAGNLRRLQVYVHADPEDREKVVETYTFNIVYSKAQENGQPLAGLQLDGLGGSSASIGATNEGLKELLRKLIVHCQDLPQLPRQRSMSMALFYERDTAMADKPAGFVLNDSTDLQLAATDGWERKAHSFTDLASGFHSTSIQISYLQPQGYTSLHGIKGLLPPTVPDCLRYRDMRQFSNTAPESDSSKGPQVVTTPSTIVRDPASGLSDALIAHNETGKEDTLNTQSSNVPEIRQTLRLMMQPELFTQGDTQTQARSSPVHNDQEYMDTSITPSKSAKGVKAALSQSVVDALETSKRRLRQKARASVQATQSDENDSILCECGYHETEGDMVQCAYCHTWQHLHCYGYMGQNDERLPETHVCYGCLLGESDDGTRAQLNDLTLKRRVMHHALRSGLSTQSQLVKDTGISLPLAKEIFNFLKEKRYVTAARRSNTARGAASRKPSLVAVTRGPKHIDMLAGLFDPLLHIHHYYEAPTASAFEHYPPVQRPKSMVAADMLPPTTPASQLRKRKAAETPASGLDLRDSVTPYKTPCLRARLDRSSKRARGSDGSVIAATPSGHRSSNVSANRIKSIRTAVMLDATGFSSSPRPSSCDGTLMV